MPRLPPVEKLPQARLRARFWPGVGYSVVTFDQLQSSSSATSWARPVSEPCPISAARWITSNDRAALESFKSDQQSNLAYDGDDCLAILSSSEWRLSRVIEEWPQITFHTTREIR